MELSSAAIGITTYEQFKTLLDRSENGIPPGEGWGTFEGIECAACGVQFVAVAMIGSRGVRCPKCNYLDEHFVFNSQTECGGDGSCLCPVGFELAELITNN